MVCNRGFGLVGLGVKAYEPAKDEAIVFRRSAPAIAGERHAAPGTVAVIRAGHR